jgi:uncharacterized protein
MKRLALILAGVALAVAAPLAAQTVTSLVQARAAGQVGERYDGYLGYVVTPSSAMVRSQTEAINIRRRALYTDLARRRGVSPQEVGITAGCALLGRVAAGESYLLGDGVWRRRGPSQPASMPNYCTGG